MVVVLGGVGQLPGTIWRRFSSAGSTPSSNSSTTASLAKVLVFVARDRLPAVAAGRAGAPRRCADEAIAGVAHRWQPSAVNLGGSIQRGRIALVLRSIVVLPSCCSWSLPWRCSPTSGSTCWPSSSPSRSSPSGSTCSGATAGMLSLGQGVFFGLGGYAMAMYLKLEAADGELPDFMTWSGLTRCPGSGSPSSSPGSRCRWR